MALINCPECKKEISDKAGKCPNCGFPLEATKSVEHPKNVPAQSRKTCPSCHSENTQTIKMMCLSGTTSGSSSGIGVTSDLDVGVGTLNSESQTALAEKYTPESSPTSFFGGCGCLFLIIGITIFIACIRSTSELPFLFYLIAICVLLLGISFLIKSVKQNSPEQKEWEAKAKLYEEGWICHKCGNTWLPFVEKKQIHTEKKPIAQKLVKCPFCDVIGESDSMTCHSCGKELA